MINLFRFTDVIDKRFYSLNISEISFIRPGKFEQSDCWEIHTKRSNCFTISEEDMEKLDKIVVGLGGSLN